MPGKIRYVMLASIMCLTGSMTILTSTSETLAAKAGSGNTFMYAPDTNTPHQLCLGINKKHNAALRSCTFVHDQAWHRGKELRKTGSYQYKNGHGQCLGVRGGSKHKAAQVVAGKCLGPKHPDQYWDVDYLNAHTYLCYVFNYHSGYLLEPRSNKKNETIVQQPWVGHSTARQEWSFEINS